MFSYMLCFPCFLRLINKLQPGSVKKINLSQLNWHKVRLNWKGFHCLLITKSHLKQAIEVLLGSLFQSPSLLFFLYFCCSLQLENLGNFIKAILAYGLKPNDIFEANDLFENGNMTQVQTTLLALASMVSEHTVQRVIVY